MKAYGSIFGVLVTAIVALANAAFSSEVPESWKHSMTDDPATNYYLAKVTLPLNNRDAELLRTVYVTKLALYFCSGVKINARIANKYLSDHAFYKLKGKAWSEAEFLVRDNLRGTTEREIAHLCAGLDYMFGHKGTIAADLLKLKNPRLAHYSDDSSAPYIGMPIIKPGKP